MLQKLWILDNFAFFIVHTQIASGMNQSKVILDKMFKLRF